MKRVWKFLGSIYFAVPLIIFTFLWVACGTIIEAKTGSHLFAATFSYDHLLFKLLLLCFFINILVSALLRYPFKRKHLPFLITHLGLLMVIAGVFVKMRFGSQGSLVLLEGAASSTITLPNTYALEVTTRAPRERFLLDPYAPTTVKGYRFNFVGKTPHAKEVWKGWFKEDRVELSGFPPIPLGKSDGPISAFKTDNIGKAIESAYFDGLSATLFNMPLEIASVDLAAGTLELAHGQTVQIQGPHPEGFELNHSPKLLFLEEDSGNSAVLAMGKGGFLDVEHFPHGTFREVTVFEDGFLGYGLECTPGGIPLECRLTRRVVTENVPEKPEERRPSVRLEIVQGKQKENVELVWSPEALQLKTGAFHGELLLAFVPKEEELPFTVRVRKSRRICYPDSNKPLSFECDLWIKDKTTGKREAVELSMNRVFESKEGYRLYLAGMSPEREGKTRRVHLVVSRDPAKWWLTIPGGIFITIGAALLFFLPKFTQGKD